MINAFPYPPPREVYYNPSPKLPDHCKPPSGMNDTEMLEELRDMAGDMSPCQMHYNKFMRCIHAHPLSWDVTMVCRRHQEDYTECFYVRKKNVRDKNAKDNWREYLKMREKKELPDRIFRYRPLIPTNINGKKLKVGNYNFTEPNMNDA